jgi:hypothetical protein
MKKIQTSKTNSRIAEILVQMTQLHAFGRKCISLANGYFDIYNKPSVILVDTSAYGTPIQEFISKGIETTATGIEIKYIISATGFDVNTGGLTSIAITSSSGKTLKDYCNASIKTCLGLVVANGPTCVQVQGDRILEAMEYSKVIGSEKMVAERKSEEEYKEVTLGLSNKMLFQEVGLASRYSNGCLMIMC